MKIGKPGLKFSLLVLYMLIEQSPKAQNASYNEVMHDLILIQQTFMPAEDSYVSCAVSYLHSMQSTPGKYLDSLQGQYKAFGTRRYNKIENTESIQNDSLIVVVYNDERSMLVLPASMSIGKKPGTFINAMDSAFIASNASYIQITQKGGVKTMTFQFAESSRYYNCTLVYDAKTYVPRSVSYILRSSLIPETGQPPRDGSLITILFRGYSNAAFDNSILNVNKYVTINAAGKASLQPGYSGFEYMQGAAK
jgi:hypothetical protein